MKFELVTSFSSMCECLHDQITYEFWCAYEFYLCNAFSFFFGFLSPYGIVVLYWWRKQHLPELSWFAFLRVSPTSVLRTVRVLPLPNHWMGLLWSNTSLLLGNSSRILIFLDCLINCFCWRWNEGSFGMWFLYLLFLWDLQGIKDLVVPWRFSGNRIR